MMMPDKIELRLGKAPALEGTAFGSRDSLETGTVFERRHPGMLKKYRFFASL
jgi:hypothetical protein